MTDLARAAVQLRTDATIGYGRGHISKRECDLKFAVAEFLDAVATEVIGTGVGDIPHERYANAIANVVLNPNV